MKERLIETMKALVSQHGYQNVTLGMLCDAAGCPLGSFRHVMGQTYAEFHRGYACPENSASIITRKRLPGYMRRTSILQLSVKFVESEGGLLNISMSAIALAARVSYSTLRHYFHNEEELREAIITHAVENGHTRIIEQAAILYPSRDLTNPKP